MAILFTKQDLRFVAANHVRACVCARARARVCVCVCVCVKFYHIKKKESIFLIKSYNDVDVYEYIWL